MQNQHRKMKEKTIRLLILIKQEEAIAPLNATQYAGFFVNGGIMQEGDTWFKHD
ncbi:hypothetical protein Q5P01_010863 [Channa striata]|uniref:Uncharacterized protein n=1 Tax=Channa striata TaxID=64152 RepID=A0AA88MT96_CHASR|nr:hypothetical protein Q5P01_010863 [Channa striata]